MSIVSPPAVGYPDYQTGQIWDGPALVNDTASDPNIDQQYGPFAVTSWYGVRVTSVRGFGPNAGTPEILLEWYNDVNQDAFIGSVPLYVYAGSEDWQAELIPNLGPFLFVTVLPNGGACNTIVLTIMPTNRTSGVSTYRAEGSVARNSSGALAVGASLQLAPSPPYHGMGTLAVVSDQDSTLTYQPGFNFSVPTGATYPITANVPFIHNWALPRAHWSFVLTNTGGGPAECDMVISAAPPAGH